MEANDGPLEEDDTIVVIHIPNVEVVILEVTMDSLGGEEEINIQAIQKKE